MIFERVQTYATDEMTVTFDPNVCIHSGNCARGLREVFQPREQRWIRPERAGADAVFASAAARIATAGMVWVAWPKKSSGVATDLGEYAVRDTGLAAGLVDVKVCAIDATWSGLKFVRRLRDR